MILTSNRGFAEWGEVFGDTVVATALLGRPDASDDDVRHAAAAAQADGFIGAMPQSYATRLGERGVTLPGFTISSDFGKSRFDYRPKNIDRMIEQYCSECR